MSNFRYETHLHTLPVSRCARVNVEETVRFYKEAGYDGIFITNHFIDGNLNYDREAPYEEKIRFYFSDYYEAKRIGDEIGFKVFPGVESSYGGTDFLIYGLGEEWFLSHPEIVGMKRRDLLDLFRAEDAVVIQAHPYREASYIDHIRLFPRSVDGVEIVNAARPDFENEMAKHYAESYGLPVFAGSDNHVAGAARALAGIETETPITSVDHFKSLFRAGEYKIFHTILKQD